MNKAQLGVWQETRYPTLSTLLNINSEAPYSPNLQGKEGDIAAALFLSRSELSKDLGLLGLSAVPVGWAILKPHSMYVD